MDACNQSIGTIISVRKGWMRKKVLNWPAETKTEFVGLFLGSDSLCVVEADSVCQAQSLNAATELLH